MREKVINQRKLGVILQYLQMILSSIISLVYTPIMLRILGKTEYGIYSVASSTIAYLSLLSLGFGTSYIRYYSVYKKDNDDEGIKKLNGLYLSVFTIIGIVGLIAGLFLTKNVNWFYNETYTTEDVELARVLMLFLTVNLAISFPASVFTSYIVSQERFIFQKVLSLGKTVLSPAFNIIMLYMGYGSIGMVISTTIISIIIDLINVFYCLNKIGMRFTFKQPNFLLLKDIFIFSIFIAINQLVEQINFQTDKIILSKVVNGAAVTVYSVGSNLKVLYVNISSAISSVFAPEINRIVSKNEDNMDDLLNAIFIKVGRIQWFVIMLIMTGFIFFGKYFIYIWAGPEYGNAYYVSLLLMVPMTFVLIQTVGGEVQRAKNLHHVRSIIYLFMAVINVLISIRFAMVWGEIGTALGTTISLVLCNILFINIWFHLRVGLNVLKFWKSILSTIPSFVAPSLVGVLIMKFHTFHSIKDFLLYVMLYSVVYTISIYFIGMNDYEKALVKNIWKKITKK